jgi:hypothetical protein
MMSYRHCNSGASGSRQTHPGDFPPYALDIRPLQDPLGQHSWFPTNIYNLHYQHVPIQSPHFRRPSMRRPGRKGTFPSDFFVTVGTDFLPYSEHMLLLPPSVLPPSHLELEHP